MEQGHNTYVERACEESKQLWGLVGPTIISRLAGFSMFIVTQAFAGHLGDLELAAITIGCTVIFGLDMGFMMGMSTSLETLCGQAHGAKKYYMLGVYMQRSWIVLFACSIISLPLYLFATPFLRLLGQPDDVAELAGLVSMWMLPMHFSLVFQQSLEKFLQSQSKVAVMAWVSVVGFVVDTLMTWLVVSVFKFGVVGIIVIQNFAWWLQLIGTFGYVIGGGCPLTWAGFSMEAFHGLWEFVKLSAAGGVMISLDNWYYKILILMTGNLKNAKISLDALSICMSILGWMIMIPSAFCASITVRISNELGAGNGKGAKFATIVATTASIVIGLFFWLLVIILDEKLAYIFTHSKLVIETVKQLIPLLAFTILLNSLQPVLIGVAVGSGWQSLVAYINLGSYYLLGIPLGYLMGWPYDLGVTGIWGGMIFGGTAVQTLIMAAITIQCDWDKEAKKASMHLQKWTELV